MILQSGGVVRSLENWGECLLPKRISHFGQKQHTGHYFLMTFDSTISTQSLIRKTLGLDPRMMRFGVVKKGTTLKEIKDLGRGLTWEERKAP
jgi:small subunit ribosomal protein S6